VALIVLAVFAFNNKKIDAPTNNTTDQKNNDQIYTNAEVPTNMTLFYSDTCPHCKNVEKYIADNNVKTKINLNEMNVANEDSVQILLAVVQKCELSQESIGVPFF
jgi:glutaredoxin